MSPEDFRAAIERRQRAPADRPELDSERARLALYGLGIAGEAGEVADEVKKLLFHDKPLDLEKLLCEVGDVLWYADRLVNFFGLELGDAMRANSEKLDARYPDGFSAAEKKYDHADGR